MIPSKKVFALILVSICLVAGAFLFAESQNPKIEYTSKPKSDIVANSLDTYKDTDGDGLKDWEEALWGTDPKVPDANKTKKPTTSTQKPKEKLTATDTLARSFFSQYMNLKEVGLAGDKESQDRLAKSLVSTEINSSPVVYTTESIKTSSNVSLRDYGNTVGSIIKRNSLAQRNELSIFRDAVSTENKKTLEELTPVTAGYKKMLNELLAMNVPPQMSNTHLKLVNTVSQIHFVMNSFGQAFTDPVVAVQGLALFQSSSDDLISVFREIVNALKSNNIIYNSTDPGYYFSPKQ